MDMEGEEQESPRYLKEQVITYLGNKRRLLPLIQEGILKVRRQLGSRRLRAFDAFSGSGIVSRLLKQHCTHLFSNDLEAYAATLNRCYLSNRRDVETTGLPALFHDVRQRIDREWAPGLMAELYAPADDTDIQPGERVFYTRRNAIYLDTARQVIGTLPERLRPFLLAPLLYGASVHTNTSGVFKGFYKNREGIGQFGGTGRNALSRILAPIGLPLPVFSRFEGDVTILQQEATAAARQLPEIDFAYLDPPYNQHPYGSNYFMLNFLLEYKRPAALSAVSGIPRGWNHSPYNNRERAAQALLGLLESIPAPFLLLSYNSEGFIPYHDLIGLLSAPWKVETIQLDYATFRGCRNLRQRPLRVKEYLFLLERR